MKIILREGNTFILRFDRGEEVIGGIAKFCGDERIEAGHFSAIGAAEKVTLSYYDLEKKKYEDMEIRERLEIAGLSGNVAAMGAEIIVHAHGCFSDRAMQSRCGHAKRVVVSATCEVALRAQKGRAERKYDSETGLNLLSL